MLPRREPNRPASRSRIEPGAGASYGYGGYGYGYGYGDHGPSAFDGAYLHRYMAALYRRRRIAIAVPLVIVCAAVAYLLVATPIYEARAKVLIEPDVPNVVSFKDVMEENASKLEYYQTQMQILRSRTLARKTIDTLDLWNDPEIAPKPENLPRLARMSRDMKTAFASMFGRLSGGSEPATGVKKEAEAQSRAVSEFLNRLTLTYRADNRILEVGYLSVDPGKATRVANAIARNYIDESLDVKYRAAKDASDWLNQQIAEVRKQVEASETSAQRYREVNGDISVSDQQNIVLQKLSDLNAAATRAKMERLDAEALYRQLQAVEKDPAALDTLPVILSNTFVQKLKTDLADLQSEEVKMSQKFGDRYPDLLKLRSAMARVQQQIRAEVEKIAQSVGKQYEAALAKERNFAAALEQQRQQALTIDRRAVQYNELQREATSNRQVFEGLLQRAKETGIASELKASNIRIVDPAETPLRPAWPQKMPILLFALVFGVPVGAAAAIGRELVDDRIKTPDDVKTILGLTFLGFAPAVRPSTFKNHGPLVNNGVSPVFAEAFRTVRANVFLSAAGNGTRILLVTSTGPNEGKTVVSSNLAVSLAQAGRRVLLVDADLRMSKVHRVFEEPLEPGFSDVLTGRMPIRDAIRPSRIAGLSILTAGATPERPGDLFEMPDFERTLKSVEHDFDFIVIDSPPVLAVSDAIGIVHVSGGVVFVVGAQMARRRAVQAAIEQLDAADANILGAVLSRVHVEEQSPYYHRSYVPYQSAKRPAAVPARKAHTGLSINR